MKERPILFNGDMVRAILDGRKTQTRRIVKGCRVKASPSGRPLFYHDDYDRRVDPKCPYGKPGDRLWVRETFRPIVGQSGRVIEYSYRATPEGRPGDDIDPWKPSIFMPRAASRITLEITDVRVERLQDISREDALAEGIDRRDETASVSPYRNYRKGKSGEMDLHCSCPERSFMTLWQSINGPDSWDASPWVWVVEFKRITENRPCHT